MTAWDVMQFCAWWLWWAWGFGLAFGVWAHWGTQGGP